MSKKKTTANPAETTAPEADANVNAPETGAGNAPEVTEVTETSKAEAAARHVLASYPGETLCYVAEDGTCFLAGEKSSAKHYAQNAKQPLYQYSEAGGLEPIIQ